MNNELICQLYCISYVKMYLFKCVNFNHTMKQDFLGVGFKSIIDAINGNAKNNFRKIML